MCEKNEKMCYWKQGPKDATVWATVYSKVQLYGISVSNPVAGKSFTYRSQNNNKNVKLFMAIGFVTAVTGLYFSW